MQDFKRDTVNKYEMEYWCQVYGIDPKEIKEKFGDQDDYNREKLSEYLFKTKQTQN